MNKTFLEEVENCRETVFWVFLNYSYKEKYCDLNLQILGKNIENRGPILNLKFSQNKKPWRKIKKTVFRHWIELCIDILVLLIWFVVWKHF